MIIVKAVTHRTMKYCGLKGGRKNRTRGGQKGIGTTDDLWMRDGGCFCRCCTDWDQIGEKAFRLASTISGWKAVAPGGLRVSQYDNDFLSDE